MRCCVQNCTNDADKTTNTNGVTFHLFPKDPNVRAAWMEALGVEDWKPKQRSMICSEHFRSEDFYETKGGLRQIKTGAVPVLRMVTEDNLDSPAAFRVCRICLAVDVKMIDFTDTLLQMYRSITGILIDGEERLPQRICWECMARLSSAVRLRAKAMRSLELLQDMLVPDVDLRIRDIKSINRSQNCLESSLIQKILYFDNNDIDVHIRVLEEGEEESENVELKRDDDTEGLQVIETVLDVQIKEEGSSNEIYFMEFDHFDDADDPALSKEYGENIKVEQEEKIEPKKLKIEKDDTPDTTTDRYKTNDVKCRRKTEVLDESLFTITSLTYDQQIDEILKRQNSSSYTNAPYKCTVCYRGFLVKNKYTVHAVRHSDQSGPIECSICKTRLKTNRALRKHFSDKHKEQYNCKKCHFVTRFKSVAKQHQKWHAGTKYQCPHCPSEFDKLTTYMSHLRIKHVSDFVCELCGYTFVNKKGIDVHKYKKHRLAAKTMTLEGPFCEVCQVKFVSKEAHDRHLQLSSRHSSDQDPNRIRNDSQSNKSERNGTERRPIIRQRDDDLDTLVDTKNPVNCEQCGIQLKNPQLYAKHFRRAHPDKNRTMYPTITKPWMCDQCGKIFQTMAFLRDHMYIHTGEKRFKCDHCNKSFMKKANLMLHMRVHSASRPTYECPHCGKHFTFLQNMQRHMLLHTGQKPFKCEACDKCYTTAFERRSHIEHVHLNKPWPKKKSRTNASQTRPKTEA